MCACKHTYRKGIESILSTAAPASCHQHLCYKHRSWGFSVPDTQSTLGLELGPQPAQRLVPQGGLLGQLAIKVGLVIKRG